MYMFKKGFKPVKILLRADVWRTFVPGDGTSLAHYSSLVTFVQTIVISYS